MMYSKHHLLLLSCPKPIKVMQNQKSHHCRSDGSFDFGFILRVGEEVSHLVHTQENAGSTPALATK